MIWYIMIWYDIMWYDIIWHDILWYNIIWYVVLYYKWGYARGMLQRECVTVVMNFLRDCEIVGEFLVNCDSRQLCLYYIMVLHVSSAKCVYCMESRERKLDSCTKHMWSICFLFCCFVYMWFMLISYWDEILSNRQFHPFD